MTNRPDVPNRATDTPQQTATDTLPAVTFTRATVPVVALVVILLAGCGDGPPAEPVAATPTSTPAEDMASAVAAAGIPPTPDPQAWSAYIAALNAIDPEIVGGKDEKTLINRGRDQCRSVQDSPGDEKKLVDLTNRRFTAPGHPDGFGEKKAAAILDAVRRYICP